LLIVINLVDRNKIDRNKSWGSPYFDKEQHHSTIWNRRCQIRCCKSCAVFVDRELIVTVFKGHGWQNV